MVKWRFSYRLLALAKVLATVLQERTQHGRLSVAETKACRAAAHDLLVWCVDMKYAVAIAECEMEPEEYALVNAYWFGKQSRNMTRDAAVAKVFSNDPATQLELRRRRLLLRHDEACDVGDYNDSSAIYAELEAVEAEIKTRDIQAPPGSDPASEVTHGS